MSDVGRSRLSLRGLVYILSDVGISSDLSSRGLVPYCIFSPILIS